MQQLRFAWNKPVCITCHSSTSESHSVNNTWPHSKAGWKACCHREGGDVIIIQMEITAHSFRQSFLTAIHCVAVICRLHTKRNKQLSEDWKKRAWEKRSNRSYFPTPGQSLCEAGVIVRLSALESYKNHQTQIPNSKRKRCGQTGFQTLFDRPTSTLIEAYWYLKGRMLEKNKCPPLPTILGKNMNLTVVIGQCCFNGTKLNLNHHIAGW